MKKIIAYILGIITAVSVTYAGMNAIDNLVTQYLTVSTQAHIGNGVWAMNVDWSGVLTFTWIGGFTTPYGMFLQTGDIVISNSTLAYPITYTSTDDVGYGVSLSWWQDIVVPRAGDYDICVSAIADTDTVAKRMFIWARINWTDVDNSNTEILVPNASTETIIYVCMIFDMHAGDYLTLMVGSDDNGSQLKSTAAWTNPTRPVSPAVITTIKKITNSDD